MSDSIENSEKAYVAAKWLKARALAGGDEMTEEDKIEWAKVGGGLTPDDLADLWKWFRR